MQISEKDKDAILRAAEGRLLDVITENSSVIRRGSSYKGTCPFCGEEGGFEYTPKKDLFKCFKCDVGGNNAITFWMKQGKGYIEALELLARQFNVPISFSEQKTEKKTKKSDSYCKRMLQESGLTPKDVQAKIFRKDENKTTTVSPVFRPGTINNRGEIISGDDVIIEYYNLDGDPVKYEQVLKGRSTGKMKEYFRVRWQHPQEHVDKNGKPFKYKSPAGSGSFLYIPERIRTMYREKQKIDRLFIQEGEKKAEKACKHGIPSVAISGIHNLGRNGVLHEDLVNIIINLEVKEIVLLFDADWNNISSNIGINDYADQRPRSFFTAAKNFKEYCVQLRNSRGVYLEIYFGHVKENEGDDKGVDDLLVHTLKGREDDLQADIAYLINERSLNGKYLKLYKITSWSDAKLMELWSLNNAADFAQIHKNILKELPEFRIGKYRWKFNDRGEIESAQPIESEEQYWQEVEKRDRDGAVVGTDYKFRYERCFRFLQNRGFGRFRNPAGDYSYIRIEHPFVETIPQHEEIRDFVKDFTREIANEDILEMLHRGGPQFLGPEKLSNLIFLQPNLENPRRDRQLFYFKDSYWEVKADEIKSCDYAAIGHQIWSDQRHQIAAKRTSRLIEVQRSEEDKSFSYRLSTAGRNCHFLRFLENASNFTWRKEKRGEEITETDRRENATHLISKLCAIGYLMLSAKDKSVAKAVVAMDGKESEVGDSNGRSGKSLIGNLLEEVKSTVYINGKYKDIESDAFLWDEMSVKTEIVVIDDVRTNFSLEFLFANITGNWAVNYKGGRRATFPFHQSPKIYLTTNHALNGEGSSFQDRQWSIAFSDFYNDTHKPVDDFGILFFDDWDFDQWNLCWNLLAECVQLYLRFGVVEAPGERIEKRKMRQYMGESFIAWADEYFSDPAKINERMPRREVQENFFDYDPSQRKFVKPTAFKKKLKKYCEWKGLLFNPNMYDPITGYPKSYNDKDGTPILDDKSGGIEYFTIGDKNGDWISDERLQELEARGELPFASIEDRELSEDDKPF